MKTIRQRANDYAKYVAMSRIDPNFQSDEARSHAAALFYDDDAREAYIEGATETLDELKNVLSVSDDKYLRENIQKMINYLEGKECKVEPKFKVKYAGNEYNVFETKDIAGVTFYGIEDEPNHIDYVKAENCEIISVYAIKENGSPYPTKPAVFSEKKPKRMISAEAKEAMYDKPACVGRNDTLLDLLNKMPSCITVDGIDYHFVLKKAVFYRAYYEGEGEEGSGKVIFGVTAYSPIDLLTEMLEELKEEGLLE